MFWEMVGIAAAVCVSFGWIPQIIKGLQTKKLDDVSLLFVLIVTIGIFLWLLYGLHIQDRIIIAANAVAFCEGVTLVLLKIRYTH